MPAHARSIAESRWYVKAGPPSMFSPPVTFIYESTRGGNLFSGLDRIHTCTIITTYSNNLIRPIHDGMPVILPKDKEAAWLDPQNEKLAELASLLKPYPPNDMAISEVDANMFRQPTTDKD